MHMPRKSFLKTREFHYSLIGVVTAMLIALNVIAFSFDADFTKFLFGDGINFDTPEEVSAREEGIALAKKIEERSIVLLKNEGKTLPLKDKKINVFGVNSSDSLFVFQGGGSSRTSDYGRVPFYESLISSGLEPNPELMDFYNSKKLSRSANSVVESVLFRNYELPSNLYKENMFDSAYDYSDTALYVISRPATEQLDIPHVSYLSNGTLDESRPTLALSENEVWLLNELKTRFDNLIIVLNCGNPMELPFYNDPDIDVIINIGYPGNSGVVSLGRILLGEVNPSGRSVDTFLTDSSYNPAYINSGRQGSHTYRANGNAHYVDYCENVYVGYRYFETLFEENGLSEEEYSKIVAYPFGHGLSYTSFSWQVLETNMVKSDGSSSKVDEGQNLDGEGALEFVIWVENNGNVEGSEVVELYCLPPYYKGEIEKPSVILAGYAKTKDLSPGKGERVRISVPLRDLASYDCYDKNNNGFVGYELEAGKYGFSFRSSAHKTHPLKGRASSDFIYSIRRIGYQYPNDPVTGKEVSNLFTDMENQISKVETSIKERESLLSISIDGGDWENIAYMSRVNFKETFPKKSDPREMSEAMNLYNYRVHAPRINESDEKPLFGAKTDLKIMDAFGKPIEDSIYDRLVETLTEEEAINLVQHAGFGTAALPSIEKPRCMDLDGPCGLNTSVLSSNPGNATSYPSTATLAQSFDIELCYSYGRAIAKEAEALGVNGWYAPGANIHRSPLGGRNFEYFSEDPLVAGNSAAYLIRGAKAGGLYCYLKHFACDEQESGQNGQYQWLTEQAFREIYARPFELAVKLGQANGVMLSKNRIGSVRSAGSTALNIDLLRNEWGFKGAVITDYYVSGHVMDADEAIRSGVDLILEGGTVNFDDTSSATFFKGIARAARNAIYCYAETMHAANTAQSLPFDHHTGAKNDIQPIWKPILIVLDCILVPSLGVYAFFVRKKLKKDEMEDYV